MVVCNRLAERCRGLKRSGFRRLKEHGHKQLRVMLQWVCTLQARDSPEADLSKFASLSCRNTGCFSHRIRNVVHELDSYLYGSFFCAAEQKTSGRLHQTRKGLSDLLVHERYGSPSWTHIELCALHRRERSGPCSRTFVNSAPASLSFGVSS